MLHLKPTKPKTFTSTSTKSTAYLTKRSDYSVSTTVTSESVTDSSYPNDQLSSVKRKSLTQEFTNANQPITNKYLQLEKSKLMHSSIESNESGTSAASEGSASKITVTSDV